MPTTNDSTGPLRTWKLTPQKLLNPQWAFSTYREEVYVRAPSETAARRYAAAQFASEPSKISPRSPWFFVLLATAEIVEDPRFASINVPGVVHPDRWSRRRSVGLKTPA
jgi:hypothetical protein